MAEVRTPLEHRIIWRLLSSIGPAGDFINQTALAQEIGASAVGVNQAIKRLLQCGILMRGERFGLSYHFRFNAALVRLA